MRRLLFAALLGALLGALAPAAPAWAQSGAPAVTVAQITVHGASLEGNLEGDSPDRAVTVFLPPSYARERSRRYPVIYGLHGYTINNEIWAREIKASESLQNAFAAGAREMILVLPSAQTLHNGSMYSASVTVGDWERFIAEDLVAYIDAHYRTLASRDSRALVGHSMGGYGAARIGMKRPDVFSALYIMSPCCFEPREAPPADVLAQVQALQSREAATSLPFLGRATLAVAAAWSPNPQKPPLYVDLPVGDAAAKANVLARWAANSPLAMADQYIFNLRRYRAIGIDAGDRDDTKIGAGELHRILDAAHIANAFEIYDGDHVSGVADRFQNHVLPLLSRTLTFGRPRR
ncbi:MAG: alpha/beta fold hydrolase [Hyphomonadaceae bacterium]|nr:alpha/beta fold hydrolase [Hyphomonadaceae bacterium]